MEDAVVALARILLVHEVERVAERLDCRLDGGFDVPAFQFEAVDFALHAVEPRLRVVEQELGAAFGLTEDALRLVLGVRLDLVRQLLRRDQRRLERLLGLAVLVDDRFIRRMSWRILSVSRSACS